MKQQEGLCHCGKGLLFLRSGQAPPVTSLHSVQGKLHLSLPFTPFRAGSGETPCHFPSLRSGQAPPCHFDQREKPHVISNAKRRNPLPPPKEYKPTQTNNQKKNPLLFAINKTFHLLCKRVLTACSYNPTVGKQNIVFVRPWV